MNVLRFSYTGDPELDKIVVRELRYNQTRWTEIWASIIMLGFGLVLSWEGDTFNSPSFLIVRQFVTEEQAAFISYTVGLVRLIALYINGRWRRTPLIRIAGCMSGFFFFGALSYALLLIGPPYTTGIATYLILAIAELHSSGRAARDAFAYDSLGTRKRSRNLGELTPSRG